MINIYTYPHISTPNLKIGGGILLYINHLHIKTPQYSFITL